MRKIINFQKIQYTMKRILASKFLKRTIKQIIIVAIVLILLFVLKRLNTSFSEKIIEIINNSIYHEFNLEEDSEKALSYGKKIISFSEKTMEVFNIRQFNRYPRPVVGEIHKKFSKKQNYGVDFLSNGDLDGKSVGVGKVINIENKDSQGLFVTIEHKDFISIYGYLSDVYIDIGDEVNEGQEIGRLGTGKDGRQYLHFEIWIDGKPKDPTKYLELNNPTNNDI